MRPHSDVAIVVPTAEVATFARHIGGPATVRNARAGERRSHDPFLPCEPGPDVLTFERPGFAHEVLLALVEGAEWVFPCGSRRIRRALTELSLSGPGGLSVQQPEIVLLHKSRATAEHDDLDFTHVLPVLTATQRAWLRSVIQPKRPDHPWLDRLG